MKRRVVITGVGTVTSLGHDARSSWRAVAEGQSGVLNYLNDPILKNSKPYSLGLVTKFDLAKWKVPHATSRMNSFLHCATDEAIRDSRMELTQAIKMTMGVSVGCMSSNMTKLTEYLEEASTSGYEKINRLTMMHILANIPAATINVKYGLKGPSGCISTACATGLSAIGEAYKWIRDGQAETALAGGVEDVYNSTCLYSSIRIQAMTTKQYDQPEQASRPFDQERSGFVLGEGAGVVVLEQMDSARRRGATIYAEVLGYACTSDGYHLTRPQANGDGIYRAMTRVLQQSGTQVSKIDHVNCHATSTPVGDEAEAKAIIRLMQSDVKRFTLSAYKSNFGHTFGAAGAIELIMGLFSMKEELAPKILNLNNPCIDGLQFPKHNIQQPIRYMLKNALGFGGINVSMLLKAN